MTSMLSTKQDGRSTPHKWCDKKNLGIRLEIDTTIPGVFFGRSVRVWCSKAKRAHPDLSLGMHYFCTPSHSCSGGSSVTPETGTTAAGPRTGMAGSIEVLVAEILSIAPQSVAFNWECCSGRSGTWLWYVPASLLLLWGWWWFVPAYVPASLLLKS